MRQPWQQCRHHRMPNPAGVGPLHPDPIPPLIAAAAAVRLPVILPDRSAVRPVLRAVRPGRSAVLRDPRAGAATAPLRAAVLLPALAVRMEAALLPAPAARPAAAFPALPAVTARPPAAAATAARTALPHPRPRALPDPIPVAARTVRAAPPPVPAVPRRAAAAATITAAATPPPILPDLRPAVPRPTAA